MEKCKGCGRDVLPVYANFCGDCNMAFIFCDFDCGSVTAHLLHPPVDQRTCLACGSMFYPGRASARQFCLPCSREYVVCRECGESDTIHTHFERKAVGLHA